MFINFWGIGYLCVIFEMGFREFYKVYCFFRRLVVFIFLGVFSFVIDLFLGGDFLLVGCVFVCFVSRDIDGFCFGMFF